MSRPGARGGSIRASRGSGMRGSGPRPR
jgi:hypothetical protein